MAPSVNYVLAQLQRWTGSHTSELSDALLLQRYVHERDENSFAALVSRYGTMVLRVCQRILGASHDVEDAFQATFLVLARKASSLRQPEALPGWLHTVARSIALRARAQASRRRSSSTSLDDTLADPRPDPLNQLTARELLDVVDKEVRRLPSAQRSTVVLCCLEGHSRDEAARQLGWTISAVKNHLRRGRRRLQARLNRHGIALSAALTVTAITHGETTSLLLLRSTVQAALRGGMSSTAAALAKSVLKKMLLVKLAGMTALVLTASVIASATVVLVYRASAVQAPEDKPPTVAVATKDSEPRESEPRTDAQGDRLPSGAIARLGTVRFRHGGQIARITFAADGKRLMTLGEDGLRLWDTATGKELRHFEHGGVARWVGGDLSRDGKILAVARNMPANSSIDFWDVASGKQIGSLGDKFCPRVCFSPDGKLLATCSADVVADVEIWDLSKRKKLLSWKAHEFQVWTIAFSADSRKLLTTGTEGKARLWNAATGQRLQEFTPSGWQANVIGQPPQAVLSPDDKLVALQENNERIKPAGGPAGWEARISLWDTATGKRLRQLACPTKVIDSGNTRPFTALAFSPDSKQIITGGPDDFLRIWDPSTGTELRRLRFEPGCVSALALSQDGKTIAAVRGRAVSLVDLASGQMKATFPGHQTELLVTALTPDGRTAITSSLDNALLVWDVATGRSRRFEGHETFVHSLYLTPDGQTLLSGGWDETLRVWDLATGQQRRQLNAPMPNTGMGKVHVSADGKSLVLVDRKQTIRLLDAATGKERQHFPAPEYMLGWTLTPDGRSLVGWSGDRKVRVWNVAVGNLLHEYPLPKTGSDDGPSPVGGQPNPSWYKAALSQDGRLLAVGSEENANGTPKHFLLLMNIATGQEVLRIEKVLSSPKSICFSPDGRMIAWGGTGDTAVHLAETTTGRERLRLDGHRGFVSSLAFSANGERLISGSLDTTALVWDLASRQPTNTLSPLELEKLWSDLARPDAVCAYQAIRKLAAAPDASVPFLSKRLRPIPSVDPERMARLIADLDNDAFTVREKAMVELEKLGDQAVRAYLKALADKPTIESRRRLEDLLAKAQRAWWDVTGERLRSLRAIEVLELAGNKEARDALQTIADGSEGMRFTEEAKAALKRLAKLPQN